MSRNREILDDIKRIEQIVKSQQTKPWDDEPDYEESLYKQLNDLYNELDDEPPYDSD